jgi:hypothetical protein
MLFVVYSYVYQLYTLARALSSLKEVELFEAFDASD